MTCTITEARMNSRVPKYQLRYNLFMIQTFEAVIDEKGEILPLEETAFPHGRRALITILDESPAIAVAETAALSERALAEDWERPEEEEAWSYLQPER
jgi:hypothetical protein